MCNDYRVKIPPAGYVEGFSQLKLPFKWASGGPPNLQPREDVRITETAPIIRWDGESYVLDMMRWSWPGPRGAPVFNFVSEGRDFSKSERVLIPTDGFYEFTTPADPKAKRKDKWLFTLTGEPWFGIAGIVKEGAFTMLTTKPGPDVAPYHDRQVVVLPLARTEDWLVRASPDVLQPLPAGSLIVERAA